METQLSSSGEERGTRVLAVVEVSCAGAGLAATMVSAVGTIDTGSRGRAGAAVGAPDALCVWGRDAFRQSALSSTTSGAAVTGAGDETGEDGEGEEGRGAALTVVVTHSSSSGGERAAKGLGEVGAGEGAGEVGQE